MKIRDLLLPGFWAIAQKSGQGTKNWDLEVKSEGIYVIDPDDQHIQIATREEMENNDFKKTFAPKVFEIMEQSKCH